MRSIAITVPESRLERLKRLCHHIKVAYLVDEFDRDVNGNPQVHVWLANMEDAAAYKQRGGLWDYTIP